MGFYEKGDVVNACAEYLRTLEVMEAHFEEKELIGEKAVFMHIVYCRLLELFSAQFMMDPAIACGEQALAYCQKEPMLSQEIPVIYYHIGKQYDKKGNKDVAINYYSKAIEGISNPQNVVYRNIISTKALCDYQVGLGIEQTVNEIRQLLVLSDNNNELLTRYLTIGGIFSEEGIYDSALRYLEPVFENKDDKISQILAANYLRCIYDSIGDQAKSNECTRFLADYKKTEGENKAMVSKLEDLFKKYINQKQKKEAEAERERSIKKTIKIFVPIAVVVVLTIILFAKLKSKKLLKEQQEKANRILGETEQEHEKELRRLQAEAEQQLADAEEKHQQKVEEILKRHEEELKLQKDQSEQEISQTRKRHEEELETERFAYEKEKDALRQNLMERVAQVRALEEALNQQREEAKLRRMTFLKEPICQSILNKLSGKNITTRENAYELGIALKDEDFEQLRTAVEKHYNGFDNMLLSQCPGLKHGHLALCHLHLLGINESEIAALKNVSYSAIMKQNESLQEKIGVEESLSVYILKLAEGLCGNQIDARNEAINGTIPHKSESFSDKNDRLEQESGMKYMQKSMQKIVMLISASPDITLSEMASQLGMSRNGVDKNIRKLKEKGIIRRVGPDKGGHWEVIE